MAQISPPPLSSSVAAASYSTGTGHFLASVCLGIMVALFGVVAVSGTALVIHSSGTSNSSVDSVLTADVVPAPTALEMAEPEIPSTQPAPASPTDVTPATDIPEASNKDHDADSHVAPKADKGTVAERRILAALSEQSMANFVDTPLVDVVEYFQRQHGIPMMLDTVAIEEVGLLVDEPINLVLAGVTLRSVLNIMLSDFELTFLIEDEVMKITTVEVASQSSATRSDQIAESAAALASERRIKDALSDVATVNFADTPLVDVVEYLQRRHDIPIMLDTISIEEAGLLVDEPISLVLAGVTLRSVLNIMLSDFELTFVIEDEVMKITTVEFASQSSATRSDQIAESAAALASERRIKDALSDVATVNFADTPLVDVVEYLQRQHDIPIILDTVAIEEAGLLVDEPINLVLAGVTLRSVLNTMLSDFELTFLIEDEVMKITTVEVAREKSASRVNVSQDRKLIEQSDDASLECNQETVIPNRPL